jgi:hypothetical protein
MYHSCRRHPSPARPRRYCNCPFFIFHYLNKLYTGFLESPSAQLPTTMPEHRCWADTRHNRRILSFVFVYHGKSNCFQPSGIDIDITHRRINVFHTQLLWTWMFLGWCDAGRGRGRTYVRNCTAHWTLYFQQISVKENGAREFIFLAFAPW